MENHLEYAYWLETLFSFCEVTDMLFTLHVLYLSPVTTIPHRWKCGFEDHWTLNLPRYITITETPVSSNFVLSHYENSVFNCPPHFSFLMTICSAPEYKKQVPNAAVSKLLLLRNMEDLHKAYFRISLI